MTAGPDKVHNRIVQSVQDQVPSDRWERLQTQDVAFPGEESEPQPDLVVLEIGADDGPGRLVPSPAVTMLVEVVSRTSVHRDYVEKRSIYAAGGVPVYLLIDPFKATCLVMTEPVGTGPTADYQSGGPVSSGIRCHCRSSASISIRAGSEPFRRSPLRRDEVDQFLDPAQQLRLQILVGPHPGQDRLPDRPGVLRRPAQGPAHARLPVLAAGDRSWH